MSNLRDFEEIYDLAQNKIHSLTVEKSKLKAAIAKEEQKQINLFVNNLIKIADFVVTYNAGKVWTGIQYSNTYVDKQRGKYYLYVERDNCIYLGKTRNTCKVKIFDCMYDKIDKNKYKFSDEFDIQKMMSFVREFNLKYEIIMHRLQDEILDKCQYQIQYMQEENNMLREVAGL